MPWREYTVVSGREAFVRLAHAPGANRSRLSRQFSISRKTAYKWLGLSATGLEPLDDRSRRPHTSPRQTPPTIESLVCEVRKEFPVWGGRKIHYYLSARGYADVPAPSSITKILRRNGLMPPSPRPQRDLLRFEADTPNALWQMDFKGHFPTGEGRCHPLTVLDDHSRFNICLTACAREDGETVREQLTHAFRLYGLPDRILMDNGSPWFGFDELHRFSQLTAWLIRHDVGVSHSRPFHPQTQGKEERFHRTLKLEVISRRPFWASLGEVQLALDGWRDVYNRYRPHESLGNVPPSTRYEASRRAFPESLPPIEYLASDEVRTVSQSGRISFRNRRLFIGEGFRHEPVALRATGDGTWDVYYCRQRITGMDLTLTGAPNV
jgi:transposase InsO family protein